MDCQTVRARLLDDQRDRLDPETRAGLRAHLDRCRACARAEAGERALSEILDRGLPQYAASVGLKRRLAARWGPPPPPLPPLPTDAAPTRTRAWPAWWVWWGRPLVPAVAVAAVLLAFLPLYRSAVRDRTDGGPTPLVTEAVNDHLRVLTSQHPLEIASGGIHQVKPWFEGRLDFAPVVLFEGDAEFVLEGGAVGYYVDRKAAILVYRYRLHGITLIVFRGDGLPWPAGEPLTPGGFPAVRSASRGFNVLLWRAGGLGYALVSDADAAVLARLAPRVVEG